MCRQPVKLQTPPRPGHLRAAKVALAGAKCQQAIRVALRHRALYAHISTSRSWHDLLCIRVEKRGLLQSKLVRGFSTATGILSEQHKRTIRAETEAVWLPTRIFSRSASDKSLSPQIASAVRIVHQLLPGGPLLALDQEVQGVPIHTPHTTCDFSQPLIKRMAAGRHTSKWSPASSSIAMAP